MMTPMLPALPLRMRLSQRAHQGFTLVELLTVIAIVGILAGIIIVVTQKAYISSQKAISTAGLRDVGTAMMLYTQDNDGYLPGPLYGGQSARYGLEERQLGHNLAKYLDLPEPKKETQVFPQLTCPLFEDLTESGTPAYFMQQTVILPVGKRNPWGYRRADQREDEGSLPQQISQIILENNEDTWAMQAADAGTNNAPQAGWATKLLKKPLYDNGRLHLYFDWHVEFVPVE